MPKQYCYAMKTPQTNGFIRLGMSLDMILFKFGDSNDPNHDLTAYQTYNPSYSSTTRDVGTGRPAGFKYGPPGGVQYDNVGTWLKNIVFDARNFDKASLPDANAQEWFKVYLGAGKGDVGTIYQFVQSWENGNYPLGTWPQQAALLNTLTQNVFPQGSSSAN